MDQSVDNQVLDGCVHIIYKNAPVANAAVIFFSALLASFLSADLNNMWLIYWFLLITATSSIRLTLWTMYRNNRNSASPRQWAKRYAAATLLVGISWASASLLMIGNNNIYVVSSIYITYVGVLTASIPTSSAVFIILISYVTPISIGMIAPYFMVGDRFSIYMSLGAAAYYVLILFIGRNMNQRTTESFSLQFQKQTLISQLHDEIQIRANTQILLETNKEQLEKQQQELENQVEKRTHQLSVINRNLEAEITERNRAEENLKHLAHHDALTGLPNRLLLNARLEHAIERARRANLKVAVFFLDLDNFKNINDSLGHTAGDRLLQNISKKLRGCVREDDTVARLGGDEFIVILEQVSSIEYVHKLAKKLLGTITAETEVREHMISTTASIGVSLFPDDATHPDELIRNADAAMYKAKSKGRNNYQPYTKELTSTAYHRVMLENGLRRAIDNDELEVYYQPQLTLADRKVFGVEALVRWRHPELGMLAPAEFLQISEDSGLIVSLGEWVLRTACKQMVLWKNENTTIDLLAVNLSSGQLSNTDLVESVADILSETSCKPEWLELEITEDFIMKEAEHAINSLNALRNLGIDIAIDDFGTGYSSLSYLKTLPINKLKIDQSFVQDIGKNTGDDAIIRAIIAMAQSLEMETIAEGIENENQEAFLLGLRCNAGQGFMYAKPMPASELNKYLANAAIKDNSSGLI